MFYQSSEDHDEYGTHRSFMAIAVEIFKNENILFKNFIESIAMSQEVRKYLIVQPEQIKALESIKD